MDRLTLAYPSDSGIRRKPSLAPSIKSIVSNTKVLPVPDAPMIKLSPGPQESVVGGTGPFGIVRSGGVSRFAVIRRSRQAMLHPQTLLPIASTSLSCTRQSQHQAGPGTDELPTQPDS